ncbi:MAG: hypothetical protein AAB869_00870 [Patescibacteria group bacterium]
MKRKKQTHVGPNQQKVMLLLLGGLGLALSHSPRQQFRIIGEIQKKWKEINRRALNESIAALYRSKLVDTKSNSDGTFTLILSEVGKRRALSFNLEQMSIKQPARWDGKWRIVMFDIPQDVKKLRETLRMHLIEMGFRLFQKSVFVHPYPCSDEIEYLMEFYDTRRYVRFVTATEIDNALELKKHFNLL